MMSRAKQRMSRKYSNTQRALASRAILDMDAFWAQTFAASGTGDLNYCDLFTHLWLLRDQPPQPKTELYPLMPNISRRTAVKYVQHAIEHGMLNEEPCATDRRIWLIRRSGHGRSRATSHWYRSKYK